MIKISHLSKKFGNLEVLKDISFQVNQGEVVSIIGPSGSGKSTLLRCATLLETMDCGDLSFIGESAATIVNGKNPIVAHEFLGDSVAGKDVVIIDDMISSGESMLDVAKQVKERGADHVFVCTTFGLFTDGLEKFDAYYEKGYISKVITTDLTYRTPELVSRPWYEPAEMSKYMASIIDTLNHDVSVAKVQSTTEKINKLLAKHR